MQNIYSDISDEWVDIGKEVQKLAKESSVTKEPELFTHVKQLLKDFKQNTNRQLIEITKGYFVKRPYGKTAVESSVTGNC